MQYHNLIAFLAIAAQVVKAETHDIDVGEDGKLTFDPSELRAEAGDQLRFHFYDASGPHDVVQGSLDQPGPCQPSTNAFYSGIMEGDRQGNQIFTINVTSSDPIYFYCSIGRHCQSGMVGVVNGPPGRGLQLYKDRSRNVVSSNQPTDVAGGVVGVDSGDDNNSSSITSSITSTASSASSGSSGTSSTESNTHSATKMPTTSATSTGPLASATNSNSASHSVSQAVGSAATTTPSGAGKNSQTPVVVALAVIMGGLVALMA